MKSYLSTPAEQIDETVEF